MSIISGLAGTGTGLIVIGICIIASWFMHLLPTAVHPWLHRALIVGMYCGGTAVLVTNIGQFALRILTDIANFFGGFGSGIGYVAIVLASVFLLLTIVLALVKSPAVSAGFLAVALVFMLALVPGGKLHQLFTWSAAPGQAVAAQVATWIGG